RQAARPEPSQAKNANDTYQEASSKDFHLRIIMSAPAEGSMVARGAKESAFPRSSDRSNPESFDIAFARDLARQRGQEGGEKGPAPGRESHSSQRAQTATEGRGCRSPGRNAPSEVFQHQCSLNTVKPLA